MPQNTQVNATVVEQSRSVDELYNIAFLAIENIERERRSRKAKEAWQRRRERQFRAAHNETLIYVRSSNTDALEAEAAILKDKATQLGLDCIQVFYDNCPAIDNPFGRSGFSKLMETVEATPTISSIFTWDPSRICRSRKHWPYLKLRLKELGVELLYAK